MKKNKLNILFLIGLLSLSLIGLSSCSQIKSVLGEDDPKVTEEANPKEDENSTEEEAEKQAEQESKKAEEAKKLEEERQEAIALAKKIDQTEINITERAGEDGKLFGSVTSKDITEALEKQKGIKVDKRKVELEMPIRNVGRIEVKIKTHQGIMGNLTVVVKGEA